MKKKTQPKAKTPKSGDPYIGFEWLGISLRVMALVALVVNPDYQRALNKRAIKTKGSKEKFDPHACRPITIAQCEDGSFEIIDGHHRWAMLVALGYTHWYCDIHYGLNLAERAALFVKLNDVKLVKSGAKFRAALCAGETRATSVRDLVSGEGFSIKLEPGAPFLGQNVLSGVSGIEKVYSWLPDGKLLRLTLQIIKKCFTITADGFVDRTARADLFVRGFAKLLKDHPKVSVEQIVGVLKGQDADSLHEEVMDLADGLTRKDAVNPFVQTILNKLENNRRKVA